MRLKVVLEPSEDGGFTAYVPSLPGCISEGETAEEAMANLREAVELYLEPVEDDLAGRSGSRIEELVV
ncbi:MAG TPA: type II toxin-antitoxin system HicB family antitoxin [Thermoanaerobaculia bacterium]|nr:type II toxin-antitoxin system HicB family antitoxin [Thermoanaerobaculia bacterium]